MFEKEISLFLTPAAGLLALKLNTVGCRIFGRSQTVGYLFFLLSVHSTVSIF